MVSLDLEHRQQFHLDSGILRSLFRPYGKLLAIRYRVEFSFVGFDTNEQAMNAVRGLHNTEYDGAILIVQLAVPKPPKQAQTCWTCGEKGHWETECD